MAQVDDVGRQHVADHEAVGGVEAEVLGGDGVGEGVVGRHGAGTGALADLEVAREKLVAARAFHVVDEAGGQVGAVRRRHVEAHIGRPGKIQRGPGQARFHLQAVAAATASGIERDGGAHRARHLVAVGEAGDIHHGVAAGSDGGVGEQRGVGVAVAAGPLDAHDFFAGIHQPIAVAVHVEPPVGDVVRVLPALQIEVQVAVVPGEGEGLEVAAGGTQRAVALAGGAALAVAAVLLGIGEDVAGRQIAAAGAGPVIEAAVDGMVRVMSAACAAVSGSRLAASRGRSGKSEGRRRLFIAAGQRCRMPAAWSGAAGKTRPGLTKGRSGAPAARHDRRRIRARC